MKFSDIPEVQLLCYLLTNKSVDTSAESGFFTKPELISIEQHTRVKAALNHIRPGGRGASYSNCIKRQRRGEISEFALHKLINAQGKVVEFHHPAINNQYHYDGLLDGHFKLEYKCLQMGNTNISWSDIKKVEHMLEHLDDIGAIVICKWSSRADFLIPWYLLNPKTMIERLEKSQYEGLLYTTKKGTPGVDYILLNTEYDDNFFRAFSFDEKIEESDEVLYTGEEFSQGIQLADTLAGLEKADIDIATYVETFTDVPF